MHKPTDAAFSRFTEKVAKLVLIAALLAAFSATVIHLLEDDPHPLNLVVPPLAFFGFSIALLLLLLNKVSVKKVMLLSYLGAIVCVSTPIWYFSVQSYLNTEVRLMETLPPVLPIVIPLVVALIVVIRPSHVFKVTLLTWLLFSLPVFGYFVLHPNEAFQPRGLDTIMLLGPVCLITFSLIPLISQAHKTMTKMHQDQDEMRRISQIDVLTGCLNRRAGATLLEALASSSIDNAGAILFDIDNFKTINDRFGHAMGDRVLREVADSCKSLLKSENQLVRWGGEEFLLIVENADLSALESIAHRLKAAIYTLDIEDIGHISASFGVSSITMTDTVQTLFERIDKAMYMAKEKGKNQIVSLDAVA